jgi:hypothetical protein
MSVAIALLLFFTIPLWLPVVLMVGVLAWVACLIFWGFVAEVLSAMFKER